MYCSKCGQQQAEGTAFCSNCGEKLNSEPAKDPERENSINCNTPPPPQAIPTNKKTKKKLLIISGIIVCITFVAVLIPLLSTSTMTAELYKLPFQDLEQLQASFGTPTEVWEEGDSFVYTHPLGFSVFNDNGFYGSYTVTMARELIDEDAPNEAKLADDSGKLLQVDSIKLCDFRLGGSIEAAVSICEINNDNKPVISTTLDTMKTYTYNIEDKYALIVNSDSSGQLIDKVSLIAKYHFFPGDPWDLKSYIGENMSLEELKNTFNVISTEEQEDGSLNVYTSIAILNFNPNTQTIEAVLPDCPLFHLYGLQAGDSIQDIDLEMIDSYTDESSITNFYQVENPGGLSHAPYNLIVEFSKYGTITYLSGCTDQFLWEI